MMEESSDRGSIPLSSIRETLEIQGFSSLVFLLHTNTTHKLKYGLRQFVNCLLLLLFICMDIFI